MYVPSVWLYIVKHVEALSLEHSGYGFSYEKLWNNRMSESTLTPNLILPDTTKPWEDIINLI